MVCLGLARKSSTLMPFTKTMYIRLFCRVQHTICKISEKSSANSSIDLTTVDSSQILTSANARRAAHRVDPVYPTFSEFLLTNC